MNDVVSLFYTTWEAQFQVSIRMSSNSATSAAELGFFSGIFMLAVVLFSSIWKDLLNLLPHELISESDYLDLTFIKDSGGKLSTRLYDKRNGFDFHLVNFPFLSSKIPSGPSYGVYISQLIRSALCCIH